VDRTKAKVFFGWEPKTGLDEGIDKSLAWYRDHVAKGAAA
jgi:nucleoside-diphosphate-sugar epimerase